MERSGRDFIINVKKNAIGWKEMQEQEVEGGGGGGWGGGGGGGGWGGGGVEKN